MRITVSQLRRIIKEETQRALRETAGTVTVTVDAFNDDGEIDSAPGVVSVKALPSGGAAGGNMPEQRITFDSMDSAMRWLDANGYEEGEYTMNESRRRRR